MKEKAADIPADNKEQYITKSEDYLLRSKAVNDNAGLVVDYFCDRVENFIDDVLRETIGVTDYVIR